MSIVIFRDDRAVAITEEALRWFHDHVPYSMAHAIEYEGYAVDDVTTVKLCAACLELVPSHRAGQVTVRTSDPENPVTVYVHNTDACRKAARNPSWGNIQRTKDARIAALKGES